MATPRETGKGRSRRIEIDYYKKPDDLRKTRRLLIVIALVVSGVWLATGLTLRGGRLTASDQSRFRSSPGELASVHHAWNERCEACHKADISAGTADNKSGWAVPFVPTAHISDAACQTCHQGPEHHPAQKKADVKSCAGCHFDHRGSDNSLIKLADSDCTSCHGDLSKHIEGRSPAIADVITSFNINHPVFSTEGPSAKDPGRVKFNHALHLNAGLVRKPGDRDLKTLAYLTDKSARDRYRRTGQKDDDAIQLACASCHVADSSDFKIAQLAGLPRSAVIPARASGNEMLPITYDNQCKSCHPLTFDGRNPSLVAPHRAQPNEIHQFLTATYAGVFLKDDGKEPALASPASPIPGRRVESEGTGIKQRVEKAVAAAEKVLYGGKNTCFECHYAGKSTAAGIPESIEIANIPAIWQPKARFDHTAHRGVDCRDCHVKAATSLEASDILIPGIESCRQCHNSSPRSNMLGAILPALSTSTPSVRAECTTCHRYHHADKPLLGRGALSERGTVDRDFAKFLSGESPR